MTFRDSKKQYGRLMKKGFSVEDAKAILPRCQSCVTVYLKSI